MSVDPAMAFRFTGMPIRDGWYKAPLFSAGLFFAEQKGGASDVVNQAQIG